MDIFVGKNEENKHRDSDEHDNVNKPIHPRENVTDIHPLLFFQQSEQITE